MSADHPARGVSPGRGLALGAGVFITLAGLAFLGHGYARARDEHEREVQTVTFLTRILPVAQSTFRERDLDGDGVYAYARDLRELADHGLIPAEYADGHAHGYDVALRQGDVPEFTWIAVASPSSPGPVRHFGVNQNGVLRLSTAPIPLSADASFPPDLPAICACRHDDPH